MKLHDRKLHRLKGYDYSQNGAYFVTICTLNRKNFLCNIVGNDALVVPTPIGNKVIECWNNIEKLNENIIVDKYCLMPNHIHGIIVISGQEPLEFQKGRHGFETVEQMDLDRERRGRRSLQGLIKDFKSVTTRFYKQLEDDSSIKSLWQASYYDEVIRNEGHYTRVLDYIDQNPMRWGEDKYFSS